MLCFPVLEGFTFSYLIPPFHMTDSQTLMVLPSTQIHKLETKLTLTFFLFLFPPLHSHVSKLIPKLATHHDGLGPYHFLLGYYTLLIDMSAFSLPASKSPCFTTKTIFLKFKKITSWVRLRSVNRFPFFFRIRSTSFAMCRARWLNKGSRAKLSVFICQLC